ncbi:hypothetical protein OAO87_01545 [bacterium]|nr:hypothetical protein [bacterium]
MSRTAFFLALLTGSAHERQMLFLTLCELLALVSSLLLVVPIEMRRSFAGAEVKGWDLAPTLADGMDALAAFTFMNLACCSFFAVALALQTASAGSQASISFYDERQRASSPRPLPSSPPCIAENARSNPAGRVFSAPSRLPSRSLYTAAFSRRLSSGGGSFSRFPPAPT